ncbi:hypothetical protein [Solidesulfovibrio alcoholivorans]|uniref:hypothetical protein n=1 Tax=Solidesulfovibrio alcoholivorans TaxID=81406 RepID=UPI0004975BF1|nr:hypothetical protein [Solidesulfovibrio alcoholivorans]
MQQDQNPTIDFFETARRECPTHFGVTAIPKLFPDVVATGTVHNAISAGVGPVHQKINGRIVLERDSFLLWLANRPRIGKRNSEERG